MQHKSEISKFPLSATQNTQDINFVFEVNQIGIKKFKIVLITTGITCIFSTKYAFAVDSTKFARELSEWSLALKNINDLQCQGKLLALQLINDELTIEKIYSLQLEISELREGVCRPRKIHMICYGLSGFFISKSKEHLIKGNRKFCFGYITFAAISSIGCRFF